MKTQARVRVTDAQIKALVTNGKARTKEPHAIAVRFDAERARYEIEMSTGGAFAVPLRALKTLPASASRDAFATVRVMPPGLSLRWDILDTGYHVAGLEIIALGRSAAARSLGRIGGAVTTAQKAKAARETASAAVGRRVSLIKKSHATRHRSRFCERAEVVGTAEVLIRDVAKIDLIVACPRARFVSRQTILRRPRTLCFIK